MRKGKREKPKCDESSKELQQQRVFAATIATGKQRSTSPTPKHNKFHAETQRRKQIFNPSPSPSPFPCPFSYLKRNPSFRIQPESNQGVFSNTGTGQNEVTAPLVNVFLKIRIPYVPPKRKGKGKESEEKRGEVKSELTLRGATRRHGIW